MGARCVLSSLASDISGDVNYNFWTPLFSSILYSHSHSLSVLCLASLCFVWLTLHTECVFDSLFLDLCYIASKTYAHKHTRKHTYTLYAYNRYWNAWQWRKHHKLVRTIVLSSWLFISCMHVRLLFCLYRFIYIWYINGTKTYFAFLLALFVLLE